MSGAGTASETDGTLGEGSMFGGGEDFFPRVGDRDADGVEIALIEALLLVRSGEGVLGNARVAPVFLPARKSRITRIV